MPRGAIGALFGIGAAARPRPEGLVYAVGDAHGRVDLLIELIETILQDAAVIGGAAERPEIVFLGDYIDRGPDSRSVLEFLVAMEGWSEVAPVFLLGNHELMLLEFLNDPLGAWQWLRYGADRTLESYGIDGGADLGDPESVTGIARALGEAMGPHVHFLQRLTPWHTNGDLLFTHAGADPRVAPEDQTIDALVWGTPGALRRRRRDGLWLVHGHRIVDRPRMRHRTISIDTGAWRSGRLTALRASADGLRFIAVEGPPGPDPDGP